MAVTRPRKCRTTLVQWKRKGQVIRCLGLSFSSRTPVERKHGPNYPTNPTEKTASLALCLKPPVQKVVFSVFLVLLRGQKLLHGCGRHCLGPL